MMLNVEDSLLKKCNGEFDCEPSEWDGLALRVGCTRQRALAARPAHMRVTPGCDKIGATWSECRRAVLATCGKL